MASNIQDKIAKLQAEEKAQNRLFTILMDNVLPEADSVCWHNSSLCEFGLTYKISNFEEVKPLIKKWQNYILPLNLEKGTFTFFRTDNHKQDSKVNTSQPVYPVTCAVSQFGTEFEFYAMVGGILLSISIEFKFDYGQAHRKVAYVDYRMGGKNGESKYVSRDYGVRLVSNLYGYKFISWASGGPEYPGNFTMYWDIVNTLDSVLTLKEN